MPGQLCLSAHLLLEKHPVLYHGVSVTHGAVSCFRQISVDREVVGMELCGGVLVAISDMFRPEAVLTLLVKLFGCVCSPPHSHLYLILQQL